LADPCWPGNPRATAVPAAAKLVVVEIRELLVDGSRTTYRVVGAGKTVVLVHGLSGSWRWWEPVLEPLAERRRVHLLDLPRLGRRLPAPELTGWLGRWLEAAKLESVDLIGHSLGGLIAAELAAEQPHRVHRLALVAPAGIPCGNTVFSRSVRLLGTLYDVRGRLPTIAYDGMRAGPFSLIRGALFASHRDLSAELASIQARTLLIWGEDDRLLPARIAAEWQRVLPGSRLVRLRCGHVPMWEAPRELASHLLDFFGDERVDHPGDKVGPGVVHGVRLTWNDDEPTAGQ
jgi:pimeloyl-ACP methyl ester carboxylesterase